MENLADISEPLSSINSIFHVYSVSMEEIGI